MCSMLSRLSSVSVSSNGFLATHYLLGSFTFSILYLFLHSSMASSSLLPMALLLKYHQGHFSVWLTRMSVVHRNLRGIWSKWFKVSQIFRNLVGSRLQGRKKKKNVLKEREVTFWGDTYFETFYHSHQMFFLQVMEKCPVGVLHQSFVFSYYITISFCYKHFWKFFTSTGCWGFRWKTTDAPLCIENTIKLWTRRQILTSL